MLLPVAKVTKLFGAERGGGVVVALYTEFPEDFAPESEPLFVRIDSLDVPLWCERFERRRAAGALAEFAYYLFGRRLEEDMPKKALSVAAFSLTLIVIGVTVICGIQPELDPTDVVFEAVSAINTVGMTTGITRDLNSISRIIIMLMMYCGRVGSVSFALIFTNTKRYSGVRNPEETISVG